MRSVLLHGSETFPMGSEDMRRFSMFTHRCLRGIGALWWDNFVRNSDVRLKVPGSRVQTLE